MCPSQRATWKFSKAKTLLNVLYEITILRILARVVFCLSTICTSCPSLRGTSMRTHVFWCLVTLRNIQRRSHRCCAHRCCSHSCCATYTVALIDVALIDVALIDVALIDVALIDVALIDVAHHTMYQALTSLSLLMDNTDVARVPVVRESLTTHSLATVVAASLTTALVLHLCEPLSTVATELSQLSCERLSRNCPRATSWVSANWVSANWVALVGASLTTPLWLQLLPRYSYESLSQL